MKMIVVLALAAMAAAEPEADPALFYSTYGYGVHGVSPYTYGAYRPYAYGAYPYTHYAYGKRSAEAEPKADAEADPALLYSTGLVNPVTYTHAVPAVHTYAAVPAVQQVATPVVNTVYNAQVQVAQPVVQQQVYSHVAQPLVYANPLVKVADHAVAATAAGYTHSANVGICTNNLGIQVPC